MRVFKAIIVGTWLIGASAIPLTEESIGLWAQWGLAGIVISFVLWRDMKREERLVRKADVDQEWMRSTLLVALDRNTEAMHDVKNSMDDVKSTIKSCQNKKPLG